MGQQQSTGYDLSQYQYVDEVVDPIYGEGKLFQKHETGEIICLIEKMIQEETKTQEMSLKLDHPNLLKIYHQQVSVMKELCSSINKLTIVYEFTSLNLITNINHRRTKNIPFTQQQLWGLLHQSLSALNYLKQFDIYPMDLKQMMISSQGSIKFHSIQSKQLSNYKKLLYNLTDDIHISPEELVCLKRRDTILNLDYEKCELFQIGLTCLYAASLVETNDIFDLKTFSYSQSKIQQRIQSLKYSIDFKSILNQLLHQDPQNRGTFYTWLNQLAQIDAENNMLLLQTQDQSNNLKINKQVNQFLDYQIEYMPQNLPQRIPEPVQSQYLISLQSNLPASNLPQRTVPQKPFHIVTPDQSRISKDIKRSQLSLQHPHDNNKSEQQLYQDSGQTVQTQNDENFDNDQFKQQQPQQQLDSNYFSNLPANNNLVKNSQYPIQMPTFSSNIQQQQPQNAFNVLKQNNQYSQQLQAQKQSQMSQHSNKSQREERIEQAVKSSKMALQQFEFALQSASKGQPPGNI
ncbi:unnamed protein product (macronuclear) [Paramecium tetraurelia]|uniref:non-specific serine/threonine protein kinase n=1 Tax=Paramecium tetraurelia TaxID=5888 RepID=A0DWW5_PARTE|nr:uncharacterized protein GSPATT00021175001 [Paramecium tetraurelia]CAK87532.1 unnamed protein product [Paramecium tetraurelia]|eukprot:XP_001454929.1 hypothetical protein (macronuclear) [Paramecium tetraurelia strain d4-2]